VACSFGRRTELVVRQTNYFKIVYSNINETNLKFTKKKVEFHVSRHLPTIITMVHLLRALNYTGHVTQTEVVRTLGGTF